MKETCKLGQKNYKLDNNKNLGELGRWNQTIFFYTAVED